MSEYELDESDIPEEAFTEDTQEMKAICPRTREEVVESPKAFKFEGFGELTCWKEMAGRNMSAIEYSNALFDYEEKKKPTFLKGFKTKAGKNFSAGIRPTDEEDKFQFVFEEPKTSQHNCPKTGKPIQIREKLFFFEGYPKGGFWKIKSKREMSVPDYIKVIEAKGEPVLFRGFKSKNNENYDAELVFHEDQIKFAYELKK